MTYDHTKSAANENAPSGKKGGRPSDKWIPWYFVFFFLVIFVVDGFMVYKAVTTHTGVVDPAAYERGVNYNAVLERRARQLASGWHSDLSLKGSRHIYFTLYDAEGVVVPEAFVTAELVRPTYSGQDFAVVLHEKADMAGQYAAAVDFPDAGYWEIRIRAEKDGMLYQRHQRVVVELEENRDGY